jgi:hypothetical protein
MVRKRGYPGGPEARIAQVSIDLLDAALGLDPSQLGMGGADGVNGQRGRPQAPVRLCI